jgi:flagellar biosynthesis protein FliP
MIEGIYIALALAVVLFITALALREAIVAIFSSFIFLLVGLSIITEGFGDMVAPYNTWIGIILILFGAFVAVKAGFELIGVDK